MAIKKMRIGIVTITNDNYNFGNRLQNYALQRVLEMLGYEVETINRPIRNNQREIWKSKYAIFRWLLPFRQRKRYNEVVNFYIWNTRYIHWSPMVADANANWNEIRDRYDYFVAGSDQIWNPKFDWKDDPYMFLQFAKPEQRVAYAPSIGKDDGLEEPYASLYASWWLDWHALSCREFEGARIIEESVGKEVPVLLDPTLLLTEKDWSVMTKYCRVPRKYIAVYMLGAITNEYKNYLNQLAVKLNCELVDICRDVRFSGSSPARFAALIQHADWVVADSFHAFAFSIIFRRPFTFIDRVGWGMQMNSRMQSLVKILQVNVPQWDSITEIVIDDWTRISKILECEQNKSKEYLRKALS